MLALCDGHGVEGGFLGGLGLDELDDGAEVADVLLSASPLGLGQQFVGDGALDSAADAEDAVVAGLGVEAGERGLDGIRLLRDEVVGAIQEEPGVSMMMGLHWVSETRRGR